MSPKDQAAKITNDLLAQPTTNEEKFGAAVVLASAGLTTIHALLQQKKVPPFQIASFVLEMKSEIRKLEERLL